MSTVTEGATSTADNNPTALATPPQLTVQTTSAPVSRVDSSQKDHPRISTDGSRKVAKVNSGKVLEVKFQEPNESMDNLAKSKSSVTPTSVGDSVRRELLTELQDKTAFTLAELESIYNNFRNQSPTLDDSEIDKAHFCDVLGHAFGIQDDLLLEHIFDAMDEDRSGTINFQEFVTSLSTIFRGDEDEILLFWFKMYDQDKTGFLPVEKLRKMIRDVAQAKRKKLQVYINDYENTSDADEVDGVQLDFSEFERVMKELDILPIFHQPHRHGQEAQHHSLRALPPSAREVLSLLGSQMRMTKGDSLISEGERSVHFYYILEGQVDLSRRGVEVSTQEEGTFVGEAALFDDLKQIAEDGSVLFTTTATAMSDNATVLRMNIRDFLPLVYHGHPGATSIVQRLGKSLMNRLEQTECRLEEILASQATQSTAGMRLSSVDWQQWRKKLLRQWALRYHKIGRRGKLEINATKIIGTKEDLSVAYSPGVAEPCLSIKRDRKYAYDYTAKGHLVGVVTNGTAVLGLGNIGPAAAKPVMEGKAVLFKKFADIDAFDIELAITDPERLVDMVVAMEPTFGGINLEDIKAPECFYVERACQQRMNVPVFHDDQHGTAIVAGAGLLNALELVHKNIEDVTVCICGVGAAGFTCAKYFRSLGVQRENLICVDVHGVVYKGREDITPDNYLCEVAIDTPLRTLAEAVVGRDVFLGLSAGGLLKPDMLLSMNNDPLVFACANPTPEINPQEAVQIRDDVIIATGRSDFPNQVNNVCAFPYIFRGALDSRAQCVNEEMKHAATTAIARLAKQKHRKSKSYRQILEPVSEDASRPPTPSNLGSSTNLASTDRSSPRRVNTIDDESPDFGRDYIIPKPFDERLFVEVSAAVFRAAVESGVSSNPQWTPFEYKHMLKDQAMTLTALK